MIKIVREPDNVSENRSFHIGTGVYAADELSQLAGADQFVGTLGIYRFPDEV